jgi:sugar phosphate isomerase/epimerase
MEVQMQLGVVGLMPADLRDVTPETAQRLRNHGFTGVSCVMRNPADYRESELLTVRQMLADAGVRVAQVNARYPDLIHPEASQRAAGIETLRHACQAARWLEAETVYVRPGSVNPAGSWTPHPENTRPNTVDRLIESLKSAAKGAEELGVTLALEGHVVSTLDTPERLLDVFEAVGSPALGHNVDPVNMIGTLADAYDSTSFLQRLFAAVRPYIVAAHAKDLRIENRLVLHIDECVIGDGVLDQVTFLRLFQAACPHGFVLIEHLPDDKVPIAKRGLDAAAAAAGIVWET